MSPQIRALILAAGQGTRLAPLTDSKPKCLVELAETSLLDLQIAVLRSQGITDITVLTGFMGDQIRRLGHRTVHNPNYATTNMVHTLFCAAQLLLGDADVVISYGDIVYEPRVLDALLNCTAPMCVAVDLEWRRYWELRMNDPLVDAETLKLDGSGLISEIGKKPQSYDEIEGQYLGLIMVKRDYAFQLSRAYRDLDPDGEFDGQSLEQMYMTSLIQYLIDTGWQVQSVPVRNGWLEVDTYDDLQRYERMHAAGTLDEYYKVMSVPR